MSPKADMTKFERELTEADLERLARGPEDMHMLRTLDTLAKSFAKFQKLKERGNHKAAMKVVLEMRTKLKAESGLNEADFVAMIEGAMAAAEAMKKDGVLQPVVDLVNEMYRTD